MQSVEVVLTNANCPIQAEGLLRETQRWFKAGANDNQTSHRKRGEQHQVDEQSLR